jgi:hypothetical protein
MSFRDDRFASEEREKVELRDKLSALKEANEKLAKENEALKIKTAEDAELDALVNRNKWMDRAASVGKILATPFVAVAQALIFLVTLPFRLIGKLFERKQPTIDPWGMGGFSGMRGFGYRQPSLFERILPFGFMSFGGLVFLFVLGIFALAIYSAIHHEFYELRDGYVTGKDFYPEHEQCGWEEECTGSGNSRHCDDVYRCHTIPPRWTVDIAYQGNASTWDVEQEQYDNIRRGQWFCARDIFHDQACVEPRQ